MKISRKSNAQEAILAWLTAELSSDRFSNNLHTALTKLNCDEEIITNAHLSDEHENAKRWQVLKAYRTWVDRDFTDYDWELVELSRQEVAELNYIDYSYWNDLSDNTRKVGAAAKNIANGKVVFNVPNDRFHSIAKHVENGLGFSPIVVVSNHNESQGEILEGHLRATGYVLAQIATKQLMAIWGKLRK